MYNLKNSKLGMTLVEMVISLVILGIMMSSTMGLIISSSNIFVATSKSAVDRQVGNYIFANLESMIKYSTHMSIYDANAVPKEKKTQSVSLEITDTNTNSGKILYKGKEDAEPFYLYDNGFYGNRTVQYTIEEAGKKHQHVKLTVKVFRDNKLVYSIDKIIKCINLALITTGSDANMIKDYSTKGGINQCIAFSVDEMLIAGGKNAFSLEYKVNEYIGKYNRILAEYTNKVNNVYDYFKQQMGDTRDADGERILKSVYTAAIKLRHDAVFGDGTDVAPRWEGDDPTTYFNLRKHYQEKINDLLKFTPSAGVENKVKTINTTVLQTQAEVNSYNNSNAANSFEDHPLYGVLATKEELYTGFLLTYYDKKDPKGTITKDEYPQFEDPETFFADTSIEKYLSQTGSKNDPNQMVIMAYFYSRVNENYGSLFTTSKANKTVYVYDGSRSASYDSNRIHWVMSDKNLRSTLYSSGGNETDNEVISTINGNPTIYSIDGASYYTTTVSPNANEQNIGSYTEHNSQYYDYTIIRDPNRQSGQTVANNIISVLGATQLVDSTNGWFGWGAKEGNCTISNDSNTWGSYFTNTTTYRLKPWYDLTEGWYYFTESENGAWGTTSTHYYFFFLKAYDDATVTDDTEGQITTLNSGRVAVKGQGKNVRFTNNSEMGFINFTSQNYKMTGLAYKQAQFSLSESGEKYAYRTSYYTLAAHKYEDYLLYGVDWNSWFKATPTGLINQFMTGFSNLITWLFTGTTKQDINTISGANATESLGFHGQTTVNNLNANIASYNLGWVVYNARRGTWYYLPAESSRMSSFTSGLSFTSQKDSPEPLDCSLRDGIWRSSTQMQQDINTRKLSDTGLFGLLDTTSDAFWTALPVGNQVEVTFD